MKSFLVGLGLSMLFLLVWLVASLIAGTIEGLGGPKQPLLWGIVYGSGSAMVLAPLYFWVVSPIVFSIRRSRLPRGLPPAGTVIFHRSDK